MPGNCLYEGWQNGTLMNADTSADFLYQRKSAFISVPFFGG
jgi:hypothetical protein